MKKDFGKWHKKKTKVNEAEGTALFHEREIWWCSLGANIGHEKDGKNKKFEKTNTCFEKI